MNRRAPHGVVWLDLLRTYDIPDATVFARVEQMLVVHGDGFQFHRMRRKFERDTRNDQRLIVAGWLPIRVTYEQARDEMPRLIQMILRQLEIRTRRAA